MRKIFKFFCYIAIFSALTLIVFYFSFKAYIVNQAQNNAQQFYQLAWNDKQFQSEDEKLIAITRVVFENFKETDPSSLLLLKIRPYLTSKYLPDFLKLPDGAIEVIVQAGMCDNAARMLGYLLKQKKYETVQWNMVTSSAAHSALLVDLSDKRKVFLDAFYGVVPVFKQKLISLQAANDLLSQGKTIQDIFLPLNEKSKMAFYYNLEKMYMAAQGQNLLISANLPRIKDNENTIIIGQINADSEDVKSEAGNYDMTPYWNYMGHKYNREWIRELTAHQNVSLEIILLDNADNGIMIAEPKPVVSGKALKWNLKKGDKIVFHDGLAKISWKRMNSYIGVDQIIITSTDL